MRILISRLSLSLVLSFLLSYAVTSFVTFDLNSANWTENCRAGTIMVWFVLFLIILIINIMITNEED